MKPTLPKLSVYDQRRLTSWITALDEVLPVYTGKQYTGHNLTWLGDSWRLIVKARDKGGYRVAFYYGHRPWACFMALALDMKHQKIYWRSDQYPPDMGGLTEEL